MRCETTSSVEECAPRARSTHGVHHAVNIVIGVVLGEVLVARVVPLVVDAVIGLTLGLIAHVVIVVFVVAILHRILLCCMGDILFTHRKRSCFWALCSSRLILLVKSELCMILFSAEAILASSTSKFGIEIPRVDDEDFNSSTESTNSTSLIHCIASVGNCEQVHTSVLNLIFQQANVEDPKSAVVVGEPQNSLKSLLH